MGLWVSVVVLLAAAAILVIGGGPFTRLVDRLADRTGIGETMAGILLVGAVTAMPGLITSVLGAARGEPEFAASNALGGIAIVGGNGFDMLFLTASDVAYRQGSLYGAIDQGITLLIGLGIVLNLLLAAGLVRRQERGIGFEGVAVLAVYGSGLVALYTVG